MRIVPRGLSVALFAAITPLACSDSTGPVARAPARLYYVACCANQNFQTLFAVGVEGGTPERVAGDSAFPGVDFDRNFTTWVSPDGSQAMLLGWRYDSGYALYTVGLDGQPLGRTPYPAALSALPGFFSAYYAGLSPDGRRLAWFADGFLHVADTDGGHSRQIYLDSLAYIDASVAWSPDGRSLAYVRGLRDQATGTVSGVQVWTMRLADGFTRPVTSVAGMKSHPAWSRDGRRLAFEMGGDILLVAADGSGAAQVLFSDASRPANSAAWSPGDSLLAIASGTGVVVIHPDGSGGQILVPSYVGASLAWGN